MGTTCFTERFEVKSPSYKGLLPASIRASISAKGASLKKDTKPELRLRKTLWRTGIRYRKNISNLPGTPDLVIPTKHIAIFCDGNFWHGKDWDSRKRLLAKGTNAKYWIAKIERNMERDREVTSKLEVQGWRVLRFWESEIKTSLDYVLKKISMAIHNYRSKS